MKVVAIVILFLCFLLQIANIVAAAIGHHNFGYMNYMGMVYFWCFISTWLYLAMAIYFIVKEANHLNPIGLTVLIFLAAVQFSIAGALVSILDYIHRDYVPSFGTNNHVYTEGKQAAYDMTVAVAILDYIIGFVGGGYVVIWLSNKWIWETMTSGGRKGNAPPPGLRVQAQTAPQTER